MAGLADEKSVGGQDGAVGIGDGEAEFAGAILRVRQRSDQQENKCGADQGGLGRDKAQMDSPKSAGDASRIFYSDHGRRPLDGSATTFGREAAALGEQAARKPTVQTATFQAWAR